MGTLATAEFNVILVVFQPVRCPQTFLTLLHTGGTFLDVGTLATAEFNVILVVFQPVQSP